MRFKRPHFIISNKELGTQKYPGVVKWVQVLKKNKLSHISSEGPVKPAEKSLVLPGERLPQLDSTQEHQGFCELLRTIHHFLKRSGEGSPQEEVSVLFSAEHSVHFEGVG